MSLFASTTVLNKYKASYFLCPRCGFVQIEEPHWLSESYSEAITATDIGLLSRNTYYAVICGAVITCLFNSRASFLDYGGGYGIFVRIMRDAGFDFHWKDRFCTNLFARGFEAPAAGKQQYELVTAWEVMEHLVDPCSEIRLMFEHSGSILFSTELMPPSKPRPGEWWYFTPEHGQHISFYAAQTLSYIADKFGARIYSDGRSLHLLTQKKQFHPFLYKLITGRRVASIINHFGRRETLMQKDYQKAVSKLNTRGNADRSTDENNFCA